MSEFCFGLARSFGCDLDRQDRFFGSARELENREGKTGSRYGTNKCEADVLDSEPKETEADKSVKSCASVGSRASTQSRFSADSDGQPRHDHDGDRDNYPLHRSSLGASS